MAGSVAIGIVLAFTAVAGAMYFLNDDPVIAHGGPPTPAVTAPVQPTETPPNPAPVAASPNPVPAAPLDPPIAAAPPARHADAAGAGSGWDRPTARRPP